MNRQKGGVTVFLSLIFLLLAALTGSLLEAARIKAAAGNGERQLLNAENTLFTYYYRPLYEQYHIFGTILPEEKMRSVMEDTIRRSMNPEGGAGLDLFNMTLSEIRIIEKVPLSENGNLLFLKEAKEYTKYHYNKERVLKNAGQTKDLPEQKETIELMEAESTLETQAEQAGQLLLKFIEAVEGIHMGKEGPGYRSDGKLKTEPIFVKMLYYGSLTPAGQGIGNDLVWESLHSRYIDIEELLGREDGLTQFRTVIRQIKTKTTEALSILKHFKTEVNELEKAVQRCEPGKGQTGERIPNKLEGLFLMEADFGSIAENADKMEDALRENLGLLTGMEQLAAGAAEDKTGPIRELFYHYHIADMRFDYSSLKTEAKTVRQWNKLASTLGKGILSLMVEDRQTLSDKSISKNKSSSALPFLSAENIRDGIRDENSRLEELTGTMEDKILLGEYINEHFTNYLDSDDDNHRLDYEQEYLIGGRSTDQENLAAVLERILIFRTVQNYISLLKDAGSRDKAEAMAAAIVGFTCMKPLVLTVKHTILLVWALEESMVETSSLLSQKRIPAVKKADQFSVSFSDILLFNKTMLKEKAARLPDSVQRGSMCYWDYISLFLFAMKTELITSRCMNLIQVNIQLQEFEGFTWNHCYYGIHAQAVFCLENNLPGIAVIFPAADTVHVELSGTYH
ncbi:DUF5702 domain-containing protein [Anaerolentibacter hominis]|uniref:DUF5702 domain-containing protein n=1 Tax=Anaerolentibacter hominis TaxID=3079009 RepID=UPI0031B891C3